MHRGFRAPLGARARGSLPPFPPLTAALRRARLPLLGYLSELFRVVWGTGALPRVCCEYPLLNAGCGEGGMGK